MQTAAQNAPDKELAIPRKMDPFSLWSTIFLIPRDALYGNCVLVRLGKHNGSRVTAKEITWSRALPRIDRLAAYTSVQFPWVWRTKSIESTSFVSFPPAVAIA